jgi:hypothetical protein
MNAVGALGMGRSIAAASLRMSAAALLFCLVAYSGGVAADPQDPMLVAQAFIPPVNQGPHIEMSSASLPRFDSGDGVTRSSRVDMTLLPTKQSALGPSLAMTSPDASSFPGGRPLVGTFTSVDLGLHWRYTSIGNLRFDVSAWRRMNPAESASLIDNRESSYGARVEMHLTPPPRSGFVADHGFLGLQLESGARITLHKGGGGKPMVYYRSKF